MKSFINNEKKRFQIKYPNGCTISVNWGAGTYCDKGVTSVEVACFNADYFWMLYDFNDKRWQLLPDGMSETMRDISAIQLTELMNEISIM
jgi:hypothetical protein